MKRLLGIVALMCALPVTAFGAELKVVATLSTFADLVETIGGSHVDVSYVAPPKFNPHFIEPRPSDVLKVKRADVFAHAGLDLELWSAPLRDAAGNREIMRGAPGDLDLSQGIALLEVPTGRVSRAEGDIHLYGNPHYWLDPRNGKIMAENIARKLSELDPDHAADYAKNLADFEKRVDAKITEWQARMAPYRGDVIMGYHNQWPYLMRFLGLTLDHFLEPKPGVPPGPKQLDSLADYAKTGKVYGIVQAVYFSDKAGKALSRNTGLPLIRLSQNVGDVPESKDYVSMIDYDVNQLASLFGGS